MEKIFIGGFGGSGSRVLQKFLDISGYNVGKPYINYVYDYIGYHIGNKNDANGFISTFDKYYIQKQSPSDFIDSINLYTKNKNDFSLKHGHFMFIFDELREWFPNSKMVYIMRNPIDNAINGYNTHIKYGNIISNNELDIINWYINETKIAMQKADYIVKLEDICFKPDNTIKTFLEFAGIQNFNLETLKKTIEIPSSIGRGKQYYNSFDLTIIGYE